MDITHDGMAFAGAGLTIGKDAAIVPGNGIHPGNSTIVTLNQILLRR